MNGFVDEEGGKAILALMEPIDETELELYEHQGIRFSDRIVNKKRLIEEIPKWKARNDDVFVVGYPKSGTTWTQEISFLVMNGGDNTDEGHNRIRVPLLEGANTHAGKMKLFNHPMKILLFLWHAVFKVILRMMLYIIQQGRLPVLTYKASIDTMPSPRLLKTHLQAHMLPSDIYSKGAKIVYVMRNPKDLAVSYFKYHKWIGNLPTYYSWDVFLDDFISGRVVFGKWSDHILGYWKRRNDLNILFLRYEDMKKNERATVKQISEFLGYHYSDDTIDRITQHTTFENMKTNLYENKPKDTRFMRKGVVGDWKNYFSDAQNKAIEAHCKEKFAGTGLTLDFE